jgi:hypothetical protein
MVTSRILFTAKQKDELWERWKNGQSVLPCGCVAYRALLRFQLLESARYGARTAGYWCVDLPLAPIH